MWNKPKKAELARVPRLYETENVALADKILYHHFYIGCCSWYLAEYDGSDTCFGYVILNGDYFNAEWGYFSMQELESIYYLGLEIIHDSSWQVRMFKELNLPYGGI